jgi:uncharacterized protein (UPF0371 family)
VNRAGLCIVDDAVVQEAARQEITRRYFKTACDYKKGLLNQDELDRMLMIMDELGLKPEDRRVVVPARERIARLRQECEDADGLNAVAIEMADGEIITGKSSEVMDAAASALLNAVKHYAHIADDLHLISPVVLEPMRGLKSQLSGSGRTQLNAQEVLIALSISAVTNPMAQLALKRLHMFDGCQAHSATMMGDEDERIFRELGIDATSDPVFASNNLFYDM